jgi:hypothetical protein
VTTGTINLDPILGSSRRYRLLDGSREVRGDAGRADSEGSGTPPLTQRLFGLDHERAT